MKRIEIKTERLLLRSYRLEDVDDVFAYARDPEWSRYLERLPYPEPYIREHAEKFVARRVLAAWDEDPAWAMVLDGRVVGGLGLRIDRSTGELHYGIAREQWGKGLVVEAARAVVDWGFRERGLAKICSRADIRNRGSWRVMEKLGMTREGLFRRHLELRGERIDCVYYGLLREEWHGPIP